LPRSFGTAVTLPAVTGSDSALAAEKKKDKKKKKPAGKM